MLGSFSRYCLGPVLVTGANGFVGRALCARLVSDAWEVVASVRSTAALPALPLGVRSIVTDPLEFGTGWARALEGVDTVIHLGARVHRLRDPSPDPLAEYRRVNALGTQRLASACATAGVRRLVYASSVKVNGDGRAVPYTEDDAPAPIDPYGVSKMEAEEALRAVAHRTPLEVVVVRPPLVYGEGVKANMLQLVRAVDRGVPLPLGAVRNRRSLVYLGNLVDALVACAARREARGGTYLVSDGEDVSTAELVQRIAASLRRPARLVSVPAWLLGMAGRAFGRQATVDRLVGSLTVDSSRLRRELDWHPPFTLAEGLHRTAAWYCSSKRAS